MRLVLEDDYLMSEESILDDFKVGVWLKVSIMLHRSIVVEAQYLLNGGYRSPESSMFVSFHSVLLTTCRGEDLPFRFSRSTPEMIAPKSMSDPAGAAIGVTWITF